MVTWRLLGNGLVNLRYDSLQVVIILFNVLHVGVLEWIFVMLASILYICYKVFKMKSTITILFTFALICFLFSSLHQFLNCPPKKWKFDLRSCLEPLRFCWRYVRLVHKPRPVLYMTVQDILYFDKQLYIFCSDTINFHKTTWNSNWKQFNQSFM